MSGFTSGMRSSNTDQWATPHYLFDALDKEFHFTLDVCADQTNHKTARYYDKAQDGLRHAWTGVCWMNPPYGRAIGDWVKKAYEESRGGPSWSASCPPGQIHVGGGITSCVHLS